MASCKHADSDSPEAFHNHIQNKAGTVANQVW